MLALIWSGAGNASDVLLLVAAIVAGLEAIIHLTGPTPTLALLPAAVALIAVGLLAV
jgi:hypothetical protein